MFLARKETPRTPRRGRRDLVIGKHRNGPTGRLELVFNAEYTRFDNLAARPGASDSDPARVTGDPW